jgi:hypothetical protein
VGRKPDPGLSTWAGDLTLASQLWPLNRWPLSLLMSEFIAANPTLWNEDIGEKD